MTSFGLIGFGEVGSAFARDLQARGATKLVAYDTCTLARRRAAAVGCVSMTDPGEAAAISDVVFVAVAADAVIDAMASLAPGLGGHPFVIDVNSVSPATKRRAAALVTNHGGRYVEAAIMTSVPPHGLMAPMLLGGPEAEAWVAEMSLFGMRLEVFSPAVGPASAAKMCRSVMVKGIEALTAECLLTARRHGVEDRVLASLAETLPHPDWPAFARYLIGRALVHGTRRSEEMREVAATVEGAGVRSLLSAATADRQQQAGRWGRQLPPALLTDPDLSHVLDAIAALGDGPPATAIASDPAHSAAAVADQHF